MDVISGASDLTGLIWDLRIYTFEYFQSVANISHKKQMSNTLTMSWGQMT